LKNILVILLLAVPLITVPTASRPVSEEHLATAVLDGSGKAATSGQSLTAQSSEHGHDSEESGCCHDYCICCTTQGTVVTALSIGHPLNAGRVLALRPVGTPDPHLKGPLRPPKAG